MVENGSTLYDGVHIAEQGVLDSQEGQIKGLEIRDFYSHTYIKKLLFRNIFFRTSISRSADN